MQVAKSIELWKQVMFILKKRIIYSIYLQKQKKIFFTPYTPYTLMWKLVMPYPLFDEENSLEDGTS